MSYYQYFGLNEEPFSTSPDPGYFWLSESHRAALLKLQVAIKLKRGLSVVMGDVGTGKTTLSRTLYQQLKDPEIEVHTIFTPFANTENQFLHILLESFQLQAVESKSGFLVGSLSVIESYLFKKAIEERRTVVLLLDEAQKLNSQSLEILRALLNFESNQEKLIQLVLMGQTELLPKLTRTKNLWDRVSLKCVLRPLTVLETVKLIRFRVERAGWKKEEGLFTAEACQLIHEISRGYPRQITRLAHDALEKAMMHERAGVDGSLIEMLVEEERMFFEMAHNSISRKLTLDLNRPVSKIEVAEAAEVVSGDCSAVHGG